MIQTQPNSEVISQADAASYKRMWLAACEDLGAIHDALGLDPDDAGGAIPIITAIEDKMALLDKAACILTEAALDEDFEADDGLDLVKAIRHNFEEIGKTSTELQCERLWTELAKVAGIDDDDEISLADALIKINANLATPTFQKRVAPWVQEAFGPVIAADKMERNHRFFEEATELVQALGMTRGEAHQLVDYTFGRPDGVPGQEVGGVMVTLAALCIPSDLDMHASGETELARINNPRVMAKIRAKQAAKPHHSPLPAAEALPATEKMTDEWYLQDTRFYTGNDVMWWAKDGKGYTSDVNKAHVYEREEAFRQAAIRGTDRAWPKSYIDGKTRPAVDMQYIDHAEAIAMQGEKA